VVQENNVDVADAIVKVKEKFGEFNVADCPKYQVYLAEEFGIK
jgi:hypothetical protein